MNLKREIAGDDPLGGNNVRGQRNPNLSFDSSAEEFAVVKIENICVEPASDLLELSTKGSRNINER